MTPEKRGRASARARPTTGLALVACVAALFLVLVVNLVAVASSGIRNMHQPPLAFHPIVTDEVTVLATRLPVPPGDLVRLDLRYGSSFRCSLLVDPENRSRVVGQSCTDLVNRETPADPTGRFYVTEEGGAIEFARGSVPSAAYLNLSFAEAFDRLIDFSRPVPPAYSEDEDRRSFRPSLEFVFVIRNDTSGTGGARLLLTDAWSANDPGVSDPRTGRVSRTFLIESDEVSLVSRDMLHLQKLLYAVEGALALAIGGLTTLWIRNAQMHVPALPRDASGTELLLLLVDRGRTFLRQLRTAYRLAGALLVVAGLFFWTSLLWFLGEAAPVRPSAVWTTWILLLVGLCYVVSLAWWLVRYRAISLEEKRWRERAEQAPSPA